MIKLRYVIREGEKVLQQQVQVMPVEEWILDSVLALREDRKAPEQWKWVDVPTEEEDGWIKWEGGKQPVANDVEIYYHRKHMLEPDEHKIRAGDLWWGVDNSDSTIISYRIAGEDKLLT